MVGLSARSWRRSPASSTPCCARLRGADHRDVGAVVFCGSGTSRSTRPPQPIPPRVRQHSSCVQFGSGKVSRGSHSRSADRLLVPQGRASAVSLIMVDVSQLDCVAADERAFRALGPAAGSRVRAKRSDRARRFHQSADRGAVRRAGGDHRRSRSCSIRWPPLADYINHLARMHVIATIDADPDLARFYEIDWQVIPNLMMDLVVPVLERVMNVYRRRPDLHHRELRADPVGHARAQPAALRPLVGAAADRVPAALQQRLPRRHDELRVRDRARRCGRWPPGCGCASAASMLRLARLDAVRAGAVLLPSVRGRPLWPRAAGLRALPAVARSMRARPRPQLAELMRPRWRCRRSSISSPPVCRSCRSCRS